MTQFDKITLLSILDCMNNVNAPYVAQLIRELPNDTIFETESTRCYNDLGWVETKVGNVRLSFTIEHDGVFFNIYTNSETGIILKNGKYFIHDEYYTKRKLSGVSLTYWENCSDAYDFAYTNGLTHTEYDVLPLDMAALLKEFRMAVYGQPMMLKFGQMDGLTGRTFFVVTTKDNRLKFIDVATCIILRISTPVKFDVRCANGYRKVVTTSGNTYHLTTK